MGSEFLLEIGCEEIPARMIYPALDYLANAIYKSLTDAKLSPSKPQKFATPRRLTIYISDLSEKQPASEALITGPPVSIAFNPNGTPTQAAIGFAKKQRINLNELQRIETEKGIYLGYRKTSQGEEALVILSRIIPSIIPKIPFPKTMYWREDKFLFVRPIRSILAIFDSKVVPFEIAGVKSSNTTFGHRFLGKSRIEVSNFKSYISSLEKNFVIIDPQKRREKIIKEIENAELKTNLKHVPDKGLADEVVFLNEYPTVIMGDFEERFLSIPREVLVTVMRKHQKYFSLIKPNGKLAPHFFAVINMDSDSQNLIKTCHERVLKARLVDGEFFWNQDKKLSLESRIESLKEVLFHEKLGSYFDKITRMENLAGFISDLLKLDGSIKQDIVSAAHLSKADLVTEMVKEFPELQGIMGGLYARHEGLPQGLWRGIYEHYRPEGMDDLIPESIEGAVVSIADKSDTLVGMLGLGIAPTGSKDPFGLRRMAAGIYRIVLEKNLDFDLLPVFEYAYNLLSAVLTTDKEKLFKQLSMFMEARIRSFYQNQGFRYDEINSVLDRAIFNPVDARKRLEALVMIRPIESFSAIFTAHKRINNILKGQHLTPGEIPDEALMIEAPEKALYHRYLETKTPIKNAMGEKNYSRVLELIETFSGVVNDFFDNVLVIHDDKKIRKNRLLLLRRVGSLFDEFCDFSSIVLE